MRRCRDCGMVFRLSRVPVLAAKVIEAARAHYGHLPFDGGGALLSIPAANGGSQYEPFAIFVLVFRGRGLQASGEPRTLCPSTARRLGSGG